MSLIANELALDGAAGMLGPGWHGLEVRAELRIQQSHHSAKPRTAIVLSVLAHAMALLALVYLRPISFAPTEVQSIEVSIIVEAPDTSAALSKPLAAPSPRTPAAPNSAGADRPLGASPSGATIGSWARPDLLRSIAPLGFLDPAKQSPAAQDWTSKFVTGKASDYSARDTMVGALGCPPKQDTASRRHIGCAPVDTDSLQDSPARWTRSIAAFHPTEPDRTDGDGGYTGIIPEMKRDEMPFATWDSIPTERPPAMKALRKWLGQFLP